VLASVGFGTGFVHCEWIVDDSGVPCLVECAGRMPGDGIIDLIEYAWDVTIVEAYLDLMRGRPVEGLPTGAPRAGAVWFLQPGRRRGARRHRRPSRPRRREDVLGVSVVVAQGRHGSATCAARGTGLAMVEAGWPDGGRGAAARAKAALELIRIQARLSGLEPRGGEPDQAATRAVNPGRPRPPLPRAGDRVPPASHT
jgi:hypothetical protein